MVQEAREIKAQADAQAAEEAYARDNVVPDDVIMVVQKLKEMQIIQEFFSRDTLMTNLLLDELYEATIYEIDPDLFLNRQEFQNNFTASAP